MKKLARVKEFLEKLEEHQFDHVGNGLEGCVDVVESEGLLQC